jgi:hypothetical protein
LTYSEQFDNAGWTKSGVTISTNSVISPDGTQNADSVIVASGTSSKYLYQSCSTATPFAFSVYLKYSSYKWIQFLINADSAPVANFDIQNGVLGSFSGCTSKIESVGNGWYRCTIFNFTTYGGGPIIWAVDSGTAARAEDSSLSGTYYAWGAQAEASLYETSYIPTTSASATRVADACFKTGISRLFGTNQGTFFIDFVYYGSEQFSYLFDITDSSNNNRFLMYDSNGSGLYYFYDSGYSQITTVQFTKGQRYKIAVKYNSSGTIWYLNGVLSATGTVSFAHQMAQVYLGIRYSLTDNTGMQVNQTIVFPTALSGTDLIALTTI